MTRIDVPHAGIVPFILSPLENERTIQNMKDQPRDLRSMPSVSTRASVTTSLPPYSASVQESQVRGAPSSAGASYARSSKRVQSRNRPSKDF